MTEETILLVEDSDVPYIRADILEGLMDSAECYFLERKDEVEYDEYDTMMAPRWKAARNALVEKRP